MLPLVHPNQCVFLRPYKKSKNLTNSTSDGLHQFSSPKHARTSRAVACREEKCSGPLHPALAAFWWLNLVRWRWELHVLAIVEYDRLTLLGDALVHHRAVSVTLHQRQKSLTLVIPYHL